MLGQLGLNPQVTEKRLGDGLYEQQLVRNQVTQLTGRVYLQGYTNNEDEYRALMTAGANTAKQFNLEPGIALTSAQMDALTSDIVWLVNQTVTLPDGSTQQVLAPVVYLAHTHANDLQPSGALIAADDVDLHTTGSATNSGVIKGGTQTVVAATDILNRGGSINSSATNGTTTVSATHDVVNASGQITGNRVAVLAGNDIVNTTLVDTVGVSAVSGNSKVQTTLLGAQGTIASSGASGGASAGDLVVSAGRDLRVHGANIAASGDAQLTAGRDITLDAVQSATSQSVTKNSQHHWEANSTTHETSAISAGGSLAMQSGDDTTLKGAQVVAEKDLTVVAGGNLMATTVTNEARLDNVATDDSTRKEVDHADDQQAVGTRFSAGGNATLAAVDPDAGDHARTDGKGNVTLTGSSLTAGATHDVANGSGAATIAASGNVTIDEGREAHDSTTSVESKRGSFVHRSTTDTAQRTQANIGVASTVSGETVAIRADRDLTVRGATVVGTHDVKLAADGNVKITTSQDTQTTSSDYQKHESGWGTSGGIGISVGSKTQADRSNTSQVTHIGSTIGSLNGNLNIAAGDHLHVSGSDLIAAKDVSGTGANVTIDAATDTMHHDETHEVKQSGFTLALKAPVLDALSNTVDQAHAASRSQDSRAAALHGMAAASGAVDMVGTGAAAAGALTNGQPPEVKLELSYGSSHSKSTFSEDSTTNKGSSVTAGGTAAFVATAQGASGHGAAGHGTSSNGAASGNVTIAGSHVKANDVLLSASNQVNLLNTTDTDSTRSTNQSSSASVGVSYGTQGLGVSASGSKAHGGDSSDAAMQNDTHVKGANSVQIVSGDDTNLIGAHLSGGQVTADIGGNLTIASVQDTATSHADQESSGGGFSISQGGGSASFSRTSGNANDSYAGVNEQAGIHAGSGGFDINVQGNTDLKGATIASEANASRNTLSTGTLSFSDIANSSSYDAKSGGFSAGATTGDGGANYRTHGASSGTNAGGAAPMLSQNDSGRDSAMTQSGVSAGTINVTDPAHQTQDVASLNRDTSNANGTVAKTPDVNTLLNNQADLMAAASAAGEAVSRRIGDYAESKMNEAKAAGDTAGVDAWKEGGANRAMMQAAGAALVTGLGSAMEGAAGAAGAGIASSLAAGKLNELSGAIADASPAGNATIDTALGNIVANVIATGAGAAVGGEVGALSAYNVDRFNRQLHPDERQWAKDNAKTFAQFYEGKTGRSITSDQAQQILLANGYIRVDQAAASGPGYDATAAQYITQYAGNLFTATPAEYKNPLLYGNANGSLTPEQRALPGAVANPTVGLVTAGVITGGLAAAPAVVAGTAAAIEACVINPVLCANHAGIAIGEIAAGGAVPAGTGAAVTGAVAGAGKAADKVGTARGATNSAAAGSAADMTTAAQLRTQLSFQEAGILDANGQLTPQAIQNSQPIALAGGKINNLAVVSELTSDGSKIADWGKYTTQSMDTSNGQSMQIHYYMNSVTGKIDYVTPDFKVKGVVKP